MSIRFSIVIPTYNRASSVANTLAGCFAQTFSNFEVVVVDDGSTDGTLAALAEITDSRLKVVSQPNGGPAAARNTGMREASGEYIAFLDSDDVWYPDYLQAADALLQETPEVLLYGPIIVDRGVGRYWVKPDRPMGTDESIYDYLYVDGAFIQTSTMVLPTSLAREVFWDETVTYGDNDQFAIDCWRTGIPFRMQPRPLTLYADLMSSDALSKLPVFGGNTTAYTNFFDWMATQRPHMSERAWIAYQARVESVGMARKQPLTGIATVFRAWRSGVLGMAGSLRQLLQMFTPRLYRQLIDLYVRWRGATLHSLER